MVVGNRWVGGGRYVGSTYRWVVVVGWGYI